MEENNITETELVSNDETNSNESNTLATVLGTIVSLAGIAGAVALVKKVRRRKAAASTELPPPPQT